MTKLVVISISKAPSKIKGKLQRLMLEIKPGVFVWKLSAKTVKQLWQEITSYKCSAFCVFAAKTETGFVIATHGESKREVVFNHGIPLILYKKNRQLKSKKNKV